MKKIVFLIGLLLPIISYSQDSINLGGHFFYSDTSVSISYSDVDWTDYQNLLGANYVNFDQYATQQDFIWMLQTTKPGEVLGFRHRLDKGSGTQRLIEFSNFLRSNGRGLRVIITVSMALTKEENLQNIQDLINAGVWIVAVELFNEPYSEVLPKLSFHSYQVKFEPLVSYIRQTYPDISFLYFATPRPAGSGISGGRNDHKEWNDSLKLYINQQPLTDGVSWHIYYNNKDCSILDTLVPTVVYNSQTLHEDLDYWYMRLFKEAYSSRLWDSTYAYLRKNYPNRIYAITETGIVYGAVDDGGAGDIKNTWTYSAIMFKALAENRKRFFEIDLHAGIALSGLISPRKEKYDSELGINLRRVEYWCYYLANKLPYDIDEIKPGSMLSFTEPGEYYYFFTNASDSYNINFSTPGVELESIGGEYIHGDHRYSSSGSTAWMLKGSEKTYEIDTILDLDAATIPSISFGYIKFTVREIPVYGCTVDSALNYNPEANKELTPSSCYYQSDCRCKDVKAMNEDLSAPCEDQTLCQYRRPICIKRFLWICIRRDG